MDPTRPTSTRIMFARLAEAVVADDPGVRAERAGGRRYTRDGDREIPGVMTATGEDGRIDVRLHLLACMPPRPLEEQVARIHVALEEAARRTGTAERLGRVEVTIHDVVAPAELSDLGRSDADALTGDAE